MTTYILYGGVSVLLIISAIVDKDKTKKSLKKSFNSFKNLIPAIIPMMIFIGIILTILSPSVISKILGGQSGILGVLLSSVIGSIAFMPGFVTFPLGASLLEHGAGYPQIAAFISSLMAVSFISLNIEIKYFGKKSAILRNTLGYIAALVFAIIIGGVM